MRLRSPRSRRGRRILTPVSISGYQLKSVDSGLARRFCLSLAVQHELFPLDLACIPSIGKGRWSRWKSGVGWGADLTQSARSNQSQDCQEVVVRDLEKGYTEFETREYYQEALGAHMICPAT